MIDVVDQAQIARLHAKKWPPAHNINNYLATLSRPREKSKQIVDIPDEELKHVSLDEVDFEV